MSIKEQLQLTHSEKRMYLRKKRMELGMTQKQFAEILGIKHGVYVKYEIESSGSRNVSDKLFTEMVFKIKQYEQEHKGEISGNIIISRYLELNRDEFMLSLFARHERRIANIVFDNLVDIIKEMEKRSEVPYLIVRK